MQRVLHDPHIPSQTDDKPFIRTECGPIGFRGTSIAWGPPPHDEADDVLVKSPGTLVRTEPFCVQSVGDGGEGEPLGSKLTDTGHELIEFRGLLVSSDRAGQLMLTDWNATSSRRRHGRCAITAVTPMLRSGTRISWPCCSRRWNGRRDSGAIATWNGLSPCSGNT